MSDESTSSPVSASTFRYIAHRACASLSVAAGAIIDFTAVQGPFNGLFDVTAVETISVDTTLTNVDLGHGVGPATFQSNPGTATVTSIALVPGPVDIKRNLHTSFAAASDCETIAIYEYTP
jgi:hypothetical protein